MNRENQDKVHATGLPAHSIVTVNFLSPAWSTAWVVLLTALAALLRLLHLTGEGLTADEGFSVFLAQTSATNFRHIVWNGEFNMVLYYAMLRGWMHLGRSEFLIRLLSVLFAAATIPVVYCLGVRLFKRSTALLACLLLAVHPADLVLSQRARSYPLVILLVTVSSLFFLRLIEKPTWGDAISYAVVSAAAVYSHFFALLIITAHWLSLAFQPKQSLPWKKLLASLLLLAGLLVPLGSFFLQKKPGGQVDWVNPLSRSQVESVLYSFTLTRERSLFYVALWAAAIWGGSRRRAQDSAWSYWFVMTWLFAPPAITIAVSLVKPLTMPRFLAVCIPASVLLAGAGVQQLARRSRPVAAILLLLAVFHSTRGIQYHVRNLKTAEDWRGASAYLVSHVEPGDLIVMEPYRRHTFDYYREMHQSVPQFRSNDFLSAPLPNPLPKNIWYMASVRSNPYWKGDRPGAAENDVRAFMEAHTGAYCAVRLDSEFSPVDIWRFTRC